jgi:RecA-family ATPase
MTNANLLPSSSVMADERIEKLLGQNSQDSIVAVVGSEDGAKLIDGIKKKSKQNSKTDPWHAAKRLDHHLAKNEKPVLDFLFPGFRMGRVGGLVSAVGIGKSMLALELAVAVACPLKEANLLGIEIPKHGRVVYLSGEDDIEEFQTRLHNIHKVLDLSGKGDEIVEHLEKNLEIIDLEDSPRDFLDPQVFAKFSEWAKGCRLIIIDTLSMFHSADENSNTEMAKVVARFKLIAKRYGCCLLFLHHTSKSMAIDGRQDEQQSTRGASVLVDNSRFICYLSGMSKQEYGRLKGENGGSMPFQESERKKWVTFGASKQNGGGHIDPFWLVRAEGGVLVRKDSKFWGVQGSDYAQSAIKAPEKQKRKHKIEREYV